MNLITNTPAASANDDYLLYDQLSSQVKLAGIHIEEIKLFLHNLPFPLARHHFAHFKDLQSNHLKLQHTILTSLKLIRWELNEPQEWEAHFQRNRLKDQVAELKRQIEDFKKSLFKRKMNYKIL